MTQQIHSLPKWQTQRSCQTPLFFFIRRSVGLILSLAMVAFTLTSVEPASGHGKKPSAPPPAPAPPAKKVNLSSYGAVGDGRTDNLKAFEKAFAAAGTGGTVIVPAGSFAFSQMLVVNNMTLSGAGVNSTNLVPLDATNSAVKLTGKSSLLNLTYNQVWGTTYGATPQTCGIWGEGALDGAVTNVSVQSNVCYFHKVNNFKLTNLVVDNIVQTGVTLAACSNITIDGMTIYPEWGSPMTITGGSSNFNVSNSSFQGQYQSSDGSVSKVVIVGSLVNSTFTNCKFLGAGVNFPFPTTAQTISNVTFQGNSFVSAAPAMTMLGYPGLGTITNLKVVNNTASPVGTRDGNGDYCFGFYIENAVNSVIEGNTISGYQFPGIGLAGCQNMQVANNSLSNIGTQAISVTFNDAFPKGGATLSISGNKTTNCCTSFGSAGVIFVDAPQANQPIVNVSILNNVDTAPENTAKYYIDCQMPGANVTGNTTTTNPPLPNNVAK